MRRVLVLWAVLTPALVVATALATVVVRHADLRLPAIASLVWVPALQAVVVARLSRSPEPGRLAASVRDLLACRPAAAVAALAAGAALAALSLPAASPLHDPRAAAAPALAAAVLLVGAAARGAPGASPAPPGDDRPWLLGAGLVLLAAGLEPFLPWLHLLPGHPLLERLPAALRYAVGLGPALLAGLLVIAAAAERAAPRGPAGALLLDASVAASSLALLVAIPAFYLRPYLVPPAAGIVRSLLLLAAGLALSAALTFVLPRRMASGT